MFLLCLSSLWGCFLESLSAGWDEMQAGGGRHLGLPFLSSQVGEGECHPSSVFVCIALGNLALMFAPIISSSLPHWRGKRWQDTLMAAQWLSWLFCFSTPRSMGAMSHTSPVLSVSFPNTNRGISFLPASIHDSCQGGSGSQEVRNTCGRSKVVSRCKRTVISSGFGKGDCVVWWRNPVRICTLLWAVWALQPVLTLSASSLVMGQSYLCCSADSIRLSYFVPFPKK